MNAVTYCERFLMLLIDLEAQLNTRFYFSTKIFKLFFRRFFNALLLSSNIIIHCQLSQFITTEHGSMFCDLLIMLKFYARFEIDDVTGLALTNVQVFFLILAIND